MGPTQREPRYAWPGAYTGRDVVAVCRQHSFFSTHDWFIVTTPMSAGIPAAERLTVQFSYKPTRDEAYHHSYPV